MKEEIRKLLREATEDNDKKEEKKPDRTKYAKIASTLKGEGINNAYIARQLGMDRSTFRKHRDEEEGMFFDENQLNKISSILNGLSGSK